MKSKFLVLLMLFTLPLWGQSLKPMHTEIEVLVANPDTFFMCAEYAPDGSHLAFTSSKYLGLWLADNSGKNVNRISDEPAIGFGFSWSPDSKYLLTRGGRYEGFRRYNQIKIIDTSTRKETQLTKATTDAVGLPVWSGVAGQVSFEQKGKLRTINSNISQPLFGKSAYYSKGKMIVYSAKNKKELYVPMPGTQQLLDVVVSPDGSKIAYQKYGGSLYVYEMETGHELEIAAGHRPRWSPDSNYITYMVTTDDGHQMTSADIFIASADGTRIYQLTQSNDLLEMNPCWSNKKDTIVFDADGVIYQLKIMDEF